MGESTTNRRESQRQESENSTCSLSLPFSLSLSELTSKYEESEKRGNIVTVLVISHHSISSSEFCSIFFLPLSPSNPTNLKYTLFLSIQSFLSFLFLSLSFSLSLSLLFWYTRRLHQHVSQCDHSDSQNLSKRTLQRERERESEWEWKKGIEWVTSHEMLVHHFEVVLIKRKDCEWRDLNEFRIRIRTKGIR